jgi:2-dehydropantoate 2-reductase
MPPSLKVLVFGAGAVGTYIGGSLALHGNSVVFIERPEVSTYICEKGFHLEIAGKTFNLQPSATQRERPGVVCTSSLEEALSIQVFDVAIFALKAYDTQAAIQSLIPHRQELPPLYCLQNGVENETALSNALGADKVIAGTLTSAIGRREAGSIVLERLRGVGVADGHLLSARLVASLDEAGLNAHLYPSAIEMKWSKMLTNLLANATSAILDMSPAEILAHPGLYMIEIEQIREALRVMDAQSLKVVDLPGTPVRLLALATRLPARLARPLMVWNAGKGRGGKMPSFHIDLYGGKRKSEVDYLNGAVVRFGERAGVATPVNRWLTETLTSLSDGRLPLESFRHKPDELIRNIMSRG